ncbi:MAG: hypothetical protein R3F29_11130 [Planctomycetota bacterium]
MRNLLWALLALPIFPACSLPTLQAHAGYAQLSLDGDLGYVNGTSAVAVRQDLESGFGLGDAQGSPVVRAVLDVGVPVFSVSAFQFSDEGTGNLTADFGDLTPGSQPSLPVRSELDMFNVKGAYAFDIGIGPVSIQPGIAVDYFDLQIKVQDGFGAVTENVDLNAPIPLGFLRAEVDLSVVRGVAEVGYMAIDIEDVDASLLDLEAMLVVNPVSVLELFVGYRYLNLQVDGEIDNDTFDTDLTISGFMIGGGITF